MFLARLKHQDPGGVFTRITTDGGSHRVRAERPPQKGCANPSEDPGNPTATVLAMETADEMYAK